MFVEMVVFVVVVVAFDCRVWMRIDLEN